MSWEDKEQVKKGNIGELIVREYLEKKGYIVYEPKTNGSHPFDKIAIKGKNNMVIVEVKTKARMNKFYATGFNLRSYKYYKSIRDKYNIYCTYLFRIRIEPDGMVRLCPFIEKFFGDLKEQNLEEIWNSEDYKAFRKKLLERG